MSRAPLRAPARSGGHSAGSSRSTTWIVGSSFNSDVGAERAGRCWVSRLPRSNADVGGPIYIGRRSGAKGSPNPSAPGCCQHGGQAARDEDLAGIDEEVDPADSQFAADPAGGQAEPDA